jgi:Cu-Zn family superoxide dismutase
MDSRRLIPLLMATALLVAMASPAAAGGAEVTAGEFETLPGGVGLGYDITGHAEMRRAPADGGKTIVTVHLRGLDPNTTYPTHVHNAPCTGTPPGGGHYQHDIGGAVDPVNEIWPAVHTNAAGIGLGMAVHGHWARADAMAIVVHYPADTSIRLACVDLG